MRKQQVSRVTIAGLAMLLMPLLTMWHEIGGHAAVCALQGSKVQTIGAFYIHCATVSRIQTLLVAFAGVTANTLLALVAYILWKKATGDRSRLVLWLIWLSQGFTAAGYLCFSGASGAGDLGVGSHGAIGPVSHALAWRLLELVVGVSAYTMLVKKARATSRRFWVMRRKPAKPGSVLPMSIMSIGVQKGPPIGVQKRPPSLGGVTVTDTLFALVAA